MTTIAVILLFAGVLFQNALAFVPSCKDRSLSGSPFLSTSASLMGTNQETEHTGADLTVPSRRQLFATVLPLLSVSFLNTESATAKTGTVQTSQYQGKSTSSRSKVSPDEAFKGLLKGREELKLAQKTYLSKKDFDGLRDFLASEQAKNINNFEGNAVAILSSKRLDDEDKKAIGTIRRYGSGADVIIMYGGLVTEIGEENDAPDYATAQKYLTRTIDSLDEVILICQNSGF